MQLEADVGSIKEQIGSGLSVSPKKRKLSDCSHSKSEDHFNSNSGFIDTVKLCTKDELQAFFDSSDIWKNSIDNVTMALTKDSQLREELSRYVKSFSLDVRSQVKDDVGHLSEKQDNYYIEIISRIDELEKSINSVKSVIHQQNTTLTTVQSKNKEMDKKVARLAVVLGYTNTQVQQQLVMNNSRISNTTSEIKRQKGKLTEVLDHLNNTDIHSKISSNGDTVTKIEALKKASDKISSSIDTMNDDIKKIVMPRVNKIETVCNDQSQVLRKVEKIAKDTNERSKALIDQTISEAQITRGIVRQSPMNRKNYTFDFHVTGFSNLIASGQYKSSQSWFINQFDSYVIGRVYFPTGRKIDIWLIYGSYPNVLGIEKRTLNSFNCKVQVINLDCEETIPSNPLDVKSMNLSFKENALFTRSNCWNDSYGCGFGTVSCDELISKGYVYQDKVVVRFKISI